MTSERIADLFSHVRKAARSLANQPSFTLPVLLTLSLAIGATVVAFSVVDNVLLRPLPYPDQDALVDVAHQAPAAGLDELGASPAIYFTYRDHNESFTAIGLWDWDDSPATVIGDGDPETVITLAVTHEVLSILGVAPLLGRAFSAQDDARGGAPTVMLSHGYWQRRFGGADVIGRTLTVQGIQREIIGVLPPTFRFFDYDTELVYPLQPQRDGAAFGSFDGRAIARLRPGVTLAAATADVERMIPILRAEFPPARASLSNSGFTPKLRTLRDAVVADLGDTLWVLFGTTVILLLAAGASVVNMVLLRNEARRHAIAIRLALGASQARVGALVAAEGAVLTAAAGVLGIALGIVALPAIVADSASVLPGVMRVGVTVRTVLFAGAITAFTALLLTVPAASRLLRGDFVGALRVGASRMTESRDRHRLRHALVVAQVALAALLMSGSGLMWRTFNALRDVPPGFSDPATVQTFQLSLASDGGTVSADETVRAHQAVLDRVRGVAGVQSAAFALFDDALPLDGDGRSAGMVVELLDGSPRAGSIGQPRVVELQVTSPDFFETLGTRVVAGRTFGWGDVFSGRPIAVVSENIAAEEWSSPAAAVGKRVRVPPITDWVEIVGVVESVHQDGLDRPAPGALALPLSTAAPFLASRTATFVVRSPRVGTPGFIRELERAVWAEQPALSLLNVRTLGDLYRRSLARTSLALEVLATIASIAMLLGLIGVYGAVGYAVAQRRREIGIRRALGERDAKLTARFMGRALLLVGAGATIGIAGSAVFSQALRSQLFGVSSADPLTFAVVTVALTAAAALASYFPARRATAVDPMEILRAE